MAAAGTVPAGMQYLYGSGEAAALSSQAYRALAQHVRASADYRQAGIEVATRTRDLGSKMLAGSVSFEDAENKARTLLSSVLQA